MSDYAPGCHPNSIKALKPFMGGDDPRRRPGVESFSRRVLNHLNNLAAADDDGKALIDLDELAEIAESKTEDHARATAARILGYVRSDGWDKISRHPRLLGVLDWLMSRQIGKPMVSVTVHHESANVPQTLEALAELCATDPAALEILADVVQRARLASSVETTAVALPAGTERIGSQPN